MYQAQIAQVLGELGPNPVVNCGIVCMVCCCRHISLLFLSVPALRVLTPVTNTQLMYVEENGRSSLQSDVTMTLLPAFVAWRLF